MQENWVLHIFILQWMLEQIFIFVFKLKVASSNPPENPQGAPGPMFIHLHVHLITGNQQC